MADQPDTIQMVADIIAEQAGMSGSEDWENIARLVIDEMAKQQPPVLLDIAAERRRQIEKEGWSTSHDDGYHKGELAYAAACYAATTRPFKAEQKAGRSYEPFTFYSDLWPWFDMWWKPKDRRRDLVRAGALIVAEIERLDRENADVEA